MSRWAGRIITKNPVTPAGPAATGSAPGMWTIPEVAYWVKQGVWPDPAIVPDPYWSYVSYLLGTTSTNAQTNNSFLDSSTNNLTITRVGTATQGAVTPYGTLWSNYFNGSSYITMASGTAAGTGDFTIEGWFNIASYSTGPGLYDTRPDFTNGAYPAIFVDSSGYLVYYVNTAVQIQGATVVSLNTWNHFALCRSGTSTRLFLNGVQQGSTYSDSNNYLMGGSRPIIGGNGYYPNAVSQLTGYVSNVRVVNGTALYTTTFTPPTTPLTAVSGTVLLTCQSNRFRDASTNNVTVNVTGTVTVAPFSPFILNAPGYSGATYGGSLYIDAQGTTTTVPNVYAATSTGLDLQTTGTLEFWVYPTARATGASSPLNDASNMWAFYGTDLGSVTKYFGMGISSTGYLYISVDATSGAAGNTSTTFIPLNTWTHIAWVRSGGANKFYVNGADVTSTFSNPSVSGLWPTTATTNRAYIGVVPYLWGSYTYLYPFAGYISNFRVVKGTAVYTGAFTPPTTPLTAITNTSLLLNFTNAGIFDASMNSDMETTGNTQVSTGQAKFGTTSVYFDGSGYLTAPSNPTFNFGTGDFTVEFWINASASGSYTQVVGTLLTGTEDGTWRVGNRFNSANEVYFARGNGSGYDEFRAAVNVNDGAWHHVAVTRASGLVRIFVDGVLGASSTIAGNCTSTNPLRAGYNQRDNAYVTGYIDDLRITRGYARYTANFTPPTAAFPPY